jgi:hypothetical protein
VDELNELDGGEDQLRLCGDRTNPVGVRSKSLRIWTGKGEHGFA